MAAGATEKPNGHSTVRRTGRSARATIACGRPWVEVPGMCASCGCAEPNQRHQEGDITLEDVTIAGANHGLTPEQVAENIAKAVGRQDAPTTA